MQAVNLEDASGQKDGSKMNFHNHSLESNFDRTIGAQSNYSDKNLRSTQGTTT